MISRRTFIYYIVVLILTTNAWAVTYEGIGIEYWAGEEFGSNKATVVVDFGLESYAFEYRWNGSATGWDALDAIDTAGQLNVDSVDYGGTMGMFVNDISYLVAEKYNYADFAGWAYYGSSDGTNWGPNGGVSFRTLSNNDWDSWLWTDYDGNWDPKRVPGEPAPEPCTILLLALGGLMLRKRRVNE